MSSIFAKQYAELYDTFYGHKNSLKEGEFISGLLRPGSVLDVACGTGRHLPYLVSRKNQRVYCQDASEDMLGVAKRKGRFVSGVTCLGVRRMEDTYVEPKVNNVVCLFDSINYSSSLSRTLDSFRAQLFPGGRVVIETWNKEEVVGKGPQPSLRVYKDCMRSVEPEWFPEKNQVKLTISVAFNNEEFFPFPPFQEVHTLSYYSFTEMFRALDAAGFKNFRVYPAPKRDMWGVIYIGDKR